MSQGEEQIGYLGFRKGLWKAVKAEMDGQYEYVA